MNEPPPPPHRGTPPPPNPAPRQGGIIAGYAVAGVALFILLNALYGFLVFGVAASIESAENDAAQVIFGLATGFGVLAVFGGGAILILLGKPVTKGLGLGVMIGWALVSICTAGFCTGINPNLYSAPQPHTWPTQIGANP